MATAAPRPISDIMILTKFNLPLVTSVSLSLSLSAFFIFIPYLCHSHNANKVVHGAERPGQPKPNPDMPSTPRGPSVPSHVVDQWCAHMRSKGIKRVLCLLSDAELSFYSDPLLPQLAAHFETSAPPETASVPTGGETASTQAKRVLRIEPQAEDALVSIVACLKAAVAAQEPVAVFCSTGQARTGMVLSFWLHHAYALSIVAAVRFHTSTIIPCTRLFFLIVVFQLCVRSLLRQQGHK